MEDSYESNTEQCLLCNQMVENLFEHYQTCLIDSEDEYMEQSEAVSTLQTGTSTRNNSNFNDTKDCIICFTPILEADYIAHVEACISQLPTIDNTMAKSMTLQDSCLNCSSTVSQLDGSGILIPCPSRHVYCNPCLQNSMKSFIETESIPVCHSMFCDYRLSPMDLSLIPLEPSTLQRLLTLIPTRQRPQCPRCQFYIDVDTALAFDQHVLSCDLDNAVNCHYCHCPQEIIYFDEHIRQCQNEPRDRQQALVDFITLRTKYPFSPQQINYFIEMRKKNHLSIDALSIVEALANFDDVFPFELPSRECDICMESCLYDDIYVFGCPDSHKLCYGCYETSCRTKMNNNEILTCGICSYQLTYGELQQLRVSPQDRDNFVQYQVQKTFESYASSGRGIIKCPNQSCKWAFEPANPMERFRVVCQVCAKEFCSMCSQQYHYRSNCQELTEITQRWFFWCDTERRHYLQKKAQKDAAYKARLKEYERQQKSHWIRNSVLNRRYRELIADEKYKATNCRLCPHCGRIVQHMGGCASMICGHDYHGGNNQSGCGKNFTWEQAKPYVATTERKPEEVMADLLNPKNNLVTHTNVHCDNCHEIVRGIRFDCIHCASLTYCEACEEKCTLQHANQNNLERQPQHVFRLITTPHTK